MNTNGDVILSQNPTDMLEQARNYLQRVQFALQESTDFDDLPPYLELFGRRTVRNWCVWGDAIERVEFE